jgi:hypothetical protein
MKIGFDYRNTSPWGGGFAELPPGEDYIFRITAAEMKTSSKGNAQVQIKVEVCNDNELKGRQKSFFYPATEKGMGRMMSLIVATGIPLDANGQPDTDDFIDKYFCADVINDPYAKTDPRTGEVVMVDSSKAMNERPLPQQGTTQAAPQQMFQAPAPVAAPVQQFVPQAVPQTVAAPRPVAAPAMARPQGNNNTAFPRPPVRQ